MCALPTQNPAGNNKFSAANSHVQNDKYMADFDRAFEEMAAMSLQQQRNVYAQLEAPSEPWCAAVLTR